MRRFTVAKKVWSVENYISYIVNNYNSDFRVENYLSLDNFENALEKYHIDLWNYPLAEIDYVAYDCDHDNYAIVAFKDYTPTGFEYRICEL